jgi:acetoin utilization protein AcuC
VDKDGKDTLFGWASRNIEEEQKAMEAGYFPGQSRKGLHLTREVISVMDVFCRILDIKSIRLEALFYHNAITYERNGYGYFRGYKRMKRINELFQPGGALFKKLDNSTPFRRPEFAQSVRGRSWAIHDGIIKDIADDLLEGSWVSPVMYRMVEKPESMITFPDPQY